MTPEQIKAVSDGVREMILSLCGGLAPTVVAKDRKETWARIKSLLDAYEAFLGRLGVSEEEITKSMEEMIDDR